MIGSSTSAPRIARGLGAALAALSIIGCSADAPTEGVGRLSVTALASDVSPGSSFQININSGLVDSLASVTIGDVDASSVLADGSTIVSVMPSGGAGSVTIVVAVWMDGQRVEGETTTTRGASALTVDAETHVASTLNSLDADIAQLTAGGAPDGVDPSEFASDLALIRDFADDVRLQVAGLSASDRAALAELLASVEAQAKADSAASAEMASAEMASAAIVAPQSTSVGTDAILGSLFGGVRQATANLERRAVLNWKRIILGAIVVGVATTPVGLVAGAVIALHGVVNMQQWVVDATEPLRQAAIALTAELGGGGGSQIRFSESQGNLPRTLVARIDQTVPFVVNVTARSPTQADGDVEVVGRLMQLIDQRNAELEALLELLGVDLPVRIPQLPETPAVVSSQPATAADLDIWGISQNSFAATAVIADGDDGTTLTMGGAPPAIGERVFLELNVGPPDGKRVQLQAAVYVAPATDCPETMSAGGNSYPVVAIGGRCWMAENLRAPVGDLALDELSWADPQNTDLGFGEMPKHAYALGSAAASATYGFVYNFYAAREACPAGWRLPSQSDVDALRQSGDASGHGALGLRSPIVTEGFWFGGEQGTNLLGFAARPSGVRTDASATWDDDLEDWIGPASGTYESGALWFWTSETEEGQIVNRRLEFVPLLYAYADGTDGGRRQLRANQGAAVRCVTG